MEYRFPHDKGPKWSSYDRQKARYDTIKHLLGSHSVGAEIGVYKGGFGEFLRHHCSLLYLVDPWYRKGRYFSGEENSKESTLDVFLRIVEVYRNEIEAGTVMVVPEFSQPFLRGLKDDSLDWVYIDSSHTYKNTKREIELSLKRVKPGGYIIGDDWAKEGVAQAVEEVLETLGVEMVLSSDNQWAFQSPAHFGNKSNI